MKEILFNYDNLKKEDIDEVIIRVKALLINDKEEIILAKSHNSYQFPGGHVEDNEELLDALKREIKEETGIEFDNEKTKLLEKVIYYTRDYHGTGKNRENDIYFYVIKTNKEYDLNNLNLDEWEKSGEFKLEKVPIIELEDLLEKTINDNEINGTIYKEMSCIIKEYLNMGKTKEKRDLYDKDSNKTNLTYHKGKKANEYYPNEISKNKS